MQSFFLFFFSSRRRHTRFSRDWSSDVCSSDLEITVLVGPSGCGKTTTLRMINRLIEATEGHILLDGVDVRTIDPPTLRRGIGYEIGRASCREKCRSRGRADD